MNDTYQEMLNKMFDRMQNNAVCLMVGTLWSVLDPLSRFAEKYKNDKRYVFVNIPALDENDESNFEYELGKGFTTEYYHDMRDRLDNNEWMAKYMQQPYVREGLVFPLDELNYFYGILPDGDYRTIAVADCAFGGGDYLSMPIAREYENGDTYVFDWIYDNRAKEFTLPKVVGSVIGNGIRQLRCEGNAGGAMYGSYVADELGKKNYKCDVTDKKAPNRMSKMEKIMAYSGDIKRKFYFLAPNVQIDKMAQNDTSATQRYRRSADYQLAMEHLGMFAGVGKNVYDDAPDGLTQLAIFEENGLNVAKVTATVNPFR